MANTSGTDTGVSPDGSQNTSIIHTINVKKIHNKYGNKINTVKKDTNIISGKLYGMNIDIYYKDRSVAGEIGLIDSGSAYSLMGINKYYELTKKCKMKMEDSNVNLVSVTDDSIQVLGQVRLEIGVMDVRKEIVFMVVNNTINFAGSFLLGTNLFKEYPLLFDFKGGNVLMMENEDDIYDHTVMPLVNLSNPAKKSYSIKKYKCEEEFISDKEEEYTVQADTIESDSEEISDDEREVIPTLPE